MLTSVYVRVIIINILIITNWERCGRTVHTWQIIFYLLIIYANNYCNDQNYCGYNYTATIAPTERFFDSSVSSLTAVEFLSLLPVQKKVFIFHPMFCIFLLQCSSCCSKTLTTIQFFMKILYIYNSRMNLVIIIYCNTSNTLPYKT